MDRSCELYASNHFPFQGQDTLSCVSSQERRAAHKCVSKTYGRVSVLGQERHVEHTRTRTMHDSVKFELNCTI